MNITKVEASSLFLATYTCYAKIKLEEFYKLRELLKDFIPVISRVDRNVDEIYKDIEGEHEGNTTDGIESHIDHYGYPRK